MGLGVNRGEKARPKQLNPCTGNFHLYFYSPGKDFYRTEQRGPFFPPPPSKGCFSNFPLVIPKSTHMSRDLGSAKGLGEARTERKRCQEVSESPTPSDPSFPRDQSSLSLPLHLPAPAAQMISGESREHIPSDFIFMVIHWKKIILFTHDTIV